VRVEQMSMKTETETEEAQLRGQSGELDNLRWRRLSNGLPELVKHTRDLDLDYCL